jgi:hypothetical protein
MAAKAEVVPARNSVIKMPKARIDSGELFVGILSPSARRLNFAHDHHRWANYAQFALG